MRLFAILILATAFGCSKSNSKAAAPVCDELRPDLYEWDYEDGQTRKSRVSDCTNGCAFVEYVGDPSINEFYCD